MNCGVRWLESDNRLEEVRQARPGADGVAIDASVAEIDTTLATFDALLRIGEIEAKARLKDFQLIDFSALVAELAEVYAPVAAEQGKLVDARIAAGVELRGDRSLLMQMISNLLENAIEHTPHGTHITVRAGRSEAHRPGRWTGNSRQRTGTGSSIASTGSTGASLVAAPAWA